MMNQIQSDETFEESDLSMLRESIRGFLERHWPADTAVENAKNPQEIAKVWTGLEEQGLTTLGSDPEETGLPEFVVVMEELGRAACPAPMIGTTLANFALNGVDPQEPFAIELRKAMAIRGNAVAIAFGEFDGDRNAGNLRGSSGAVTGRVAHVEDAANVSHLIACLGPEPELALVSLAGAGVSVEATAGLSQPSLSRVNLEDVAAPSLGVPLRLIDDLSLIARLGLVARGLGAAVRSFEMIVDYVKIRHQFGQPIGRFQAVQHKLVNCAISLEGTRQLVEGAAAAHRRQDGDWRFLASASFAFASPNLRQTALEIQHVFGAIGYSEEHEAPRHFRRIHSDMLRFGGVHRARAELADVFLDGGGHGLPDEDLGPKGNAFREELRAWFALNWGDDRKDEHRKKPFVQRRHDPTFRRLLGETGWFGVAWPKAFGGQERTLFEQVAYHEELQASEAPAEPPSLQGPAIIRFGTKAQQDQYLPRILRGEIDFCLGYSEPEAGSDLASMRTRAERDGDVWVINGQKTWNTGIAFADYIWLAARTDPDIKPKQAGISLFIVPVDTPGVTVQPSMAMYGRTFSTVFLDDVRVPADALVGEVNQGWRILTSALADERIHLGAGIHRVRRLFTYLVQHLARDRGGEAAGDALVRDRIGALAAEIEAGRRLLRYSVKIAESGQVPVAEAAMSKVYSGEMMERFCEAAMELLGTSSTLSEGSEGVIPDNGRLEQLLRHSIMYVIGGGAAEIQRTLIAVRGLGLPK